MRLFNLISALVIALIFVGMASHSYAQETAQDAQVYFFSGVQDLPLMPGLVELPDQAVSFDKAEGRIAELYALTRGASQQDIEGFYEQALPQFGWQRIKPATYSRNGEILRLIFEIGAASRLDASAGQDYLKIIITPS